MPVFMQFTVGLLFITVEQNKYTTKSFYHSSPLSRSRNNGWFIRCILKCYAHLRSYYHNNGTYTCQLCGIVNAVPYQIRYENPNLNKRWNIFVQISAIVPIQSSCTMYSHRLFFRNKNIAIYKYISFSPKRVFLTVRFSVKL